MTITIFGATSNTALQIIQQALAKNYTVKAFGRNIESLIDKDLRDEKFVAIKGYVFDEDDVMKAIKGSDAVISCLGGSIDGTDRTRSLGTKNIVTQMQKLDVKRIVAIGGVGVLNADDDTLVMDTETYPEEYKAVALEHLAVLHLLQQSHLDFSFICPATIVENSTATTYTTSKTHLPQPNNNKVSTINLASCMLQCVEQNLFVKEKVGISDC